MKYEEIFSVGFDPRGYTSRLSLARSFGGTPLRDQFGYLWDLEEVSKAPNPFAKEGK